MKQERKGGYTKTNKRSSGFNKESKDSFKKQYEKDAKGSYSKPYERDEKRPYSKPYAKDEKRPFSKPFSKDEKRPYSKPFAKDEKRPYSKPFARDEKRPYSKPYAKDEKRPYSKPFARDEKRPYSKPYAKDAKDTYSKPYNKPDVTPETEESEIFQLEGRNAVLEALKGDRPIDCLLVKKGESEGTIKVIIALAKEKGVVIKEMVKEKMDEISNTGKHQGVIAYCAAHEYAGIDDCFKLAEEKNENPFIIVLDGITDPHNLGAIIRTANAVGVHGVIIPKRRSVGLTAVVGKTSAGAIQYVPVARVVNIKNCIDDLKKKGVWVACSDMDGESLYEANSKLLDGPLAIVIGNEGSGVSRLIRESCDFTVSIPMLGEIGSLNASVAASVLMYEVLRRRLAKAEQPPIV